MLFLGKISALFLMSEAQISALFFMSEAPLQLTLSVCSSVCLSVHR